MPPVRGRSRRRGEVSPRRDFSPRRRVIRSRDRFRDRERDIDRRGKEEKRANTLMQSAYNLSAKNAQRRRNRIRSGTDAFNKYLEEQRDKSNQAQGPKVQPPAKRRKGPLRIPEISLTKALGNSPAYQNYLKARGASTKLANKGGLMKKGHSDLRKGGLFYK